MRYLVLLMSLAMAVHGVAVAAPGPLGLIGGVVDSAGRPVAAAEVEVYRLDGGFMGTATTGADGGFRYAGPVSPGSLWQLRVWARGFRTASTGWYDPSVRGAMEVRLAPMMGTLQVRAMDADGGPVAATVTLAGPGGQVVWERTSDRLLQSDAVAGEYRMVVAAPGFSPVARSLTVVAGSAGRAVVVLERSTASLTGQVRDEVTGVPLGAALVEVLGTGDRVVGRAAADASGRFAMDVAPVHDESYRVRVSARGHRTAVTEGLGLHSGDRRDWSAGDALSLAPLTAVVTGVVQDSFGFGRSAQRVVLVRMGFGEVASTTTTESGQFEFSSVVAGPELQYRVIAEWAGDAVDSGWVTPRPGGTTQVPLRARGGSGDSFGLGLVTGVVAGPGGAPLVGAKVELLRHGTVLRTAETDSIGAFTLRDVPGTQGAWYSVDPYAVRVSKGGYAAAREVTLDGKSTVDLPVPSQGWAQVQAVLYPLEVVVHGRVLEVSGGAVGGAAVDLVPEGGASVGRVRTDPDGWYSLAVAPISGLSYAVRVERAGYATVTGVDVSAGVHSGLDLPTVRLAPVSTTFIGQVLDPDGRGVSGAVVAVRGPGGEVVGSGAADEQGLYRVSAPVVWSGLVTVTAHRDGWSSALAEVPDRPGAQGRVVRDLVLFPATTVVEGRVSVPDGAFVELLAEGQGVIGATLTQGGAYRFAGVPASAGWVWVRVHPVVDAVSGEVIRQP